jgi:hypothetical protein
MDTEIIKNSQTIAEAIKKTYGYDNGKTRKKFFDFVEKTNLDITHLRKRELKYPIVNKICPVCGTIFETRKGSKEVAITILIGKMILTEQLVFITTKKNVLYVEKKKL